MPIEYAATTRQQRRTRKIQINLQRAYRLLNQELAEAARQRRLIVGVAVLLCVVPLHAQRVIKQSTAYTRTFLMVDSADHFTGKTGLTVVCKISKAGATGVTPGGTISQVDSTNNPGVYKIVYTTTDTNTLGDLSATCTSSGADPTDFGDQVVAYDTTDAAALGLSRVDAAVTTRMATFSLPTNFSTLSIDANGRIKPLTGLNKNVAFANFLFQMTDSTTHAPKTGISGGSFTKQYSLDGAAFAALGGTVVEVASGWYRINLAAGELNANVVALRFAASGADDTALTILLAQ